MSDTNRREMNRCWKRPTLTPRPLSRRADNSPAAAVGQPTLAAIAGVPRLMAVFEEIRRSGGQAPGPDRLRFSDIGLSELGGIMKRVGTEVLGRAYVVPPSRAVKRPKKDDTFRTLTVDSIVHRALVRAAQMTLSPVVAPHVSPRSHSVGGRGVHTLLASLYWTFASGRFAAMVNHDVRTAFPSLPVNVAMHVFRIYLEDPGVLWLVETLLRGAGARPNQLGIPQGLAISPLALETVMSWYFDRYWSSDPDSPLVFARYVDNLIFFNASMHEGRHVVDRCRVLLHRIGLSLKDLPENETIIDLYGGQRTELLGFTVSATQKSLKFDIDSAALDSGRSPDSLRSRLAEAHHSSHPPITARAGLMGWISAMSPAFDNERSSDITERIFRVAQLTGHREFSLSFIRKAWESAGGKWQHFLHRHRPG